MQQEFSKIVTPKFEIAQAIKISSSMPGLMAPYKYDDSFLVDGDLQKASPMWKLSENLTPNSAVCSRTPKAQKQGAEITLHLPDVTHASVPELLE